MKFKNLDINILYILDKHHHYTSGDGFSEPDRFHRAFSDIPGENVSAVMKALHKDGLIYYHDRGREELSLSPPSEPCVRFSRTRLSSRWFQHRGRLASA